MAYVAAGTGRGYNRFFATLRSPAGKEMVPGPSVFVERSDYRIIQRRLDPADLDECRRPFREPPRRASGLEVARHSWVGAAVVDDVEVLALSRQRIQDPGQDAFTCGARRTTAVPASSLRSRGARRALRGDTRDRYPHAVTDFRRFRGFAEFETGRQDFAGDEVTMCRCPPGPPVGHRHHHGDAVRHVQTG